MEKNLIECALTEYLVLTILTVFITSIQQIAIHYYVITFIIWADNVILL